MAGERRFHWADASSGVGVGSSTGGEIGFRGLQGLFACCPIIVVDVPLAPVQASLKKSNLIDPVVPVFAAIAHCHRNGSPHSHRKLGRSCLARWLGIYVAWVGLPCWLALVTSLLFTLKAFFRLGAVVLWPLVGLLVCEGPDARDAFL